MFRYLTIISLLHILVFTSKAQVKVEGHYWLTSVEGNAAIGFNNLIGTSIDVEKDLGYDDQEGAVGARVVLGNGHQIGVDYLEASFSEVNSINRTIQFRDLRFSATANLASKVDATAIRAFYRFALGNEIFRGGLLLGFQYVDLEAVASASNVGATDTNLKTAFPVIGGTVLLHPLPFLALQGSIVGASWEVGDVEASYLDAEGAIRLYPLPFVFAGIGYRQLKVDVFDDEDNIDLDLTFSGPVGYVGFNW